MTHTDSNPAVEFGPVSLSVQDFLKDLHLRCQLLPLLRQTAVERYLVSRAASGGVKISTGDLQAAADAFRRLCGLQSAQRMRQWLAEQELSLDDFEASMERKLAIQKLKTRFTDQQVAEFFAAREADYMRAELRQIVVEREDLALELLSQIHDEGRDFAELARSHSIHPSARQGGSMGAPFRAELPAAVGAAVFVAAEGATVGPIAAPDGFFLVRIECLLPARLDKETSALIREQLFQEWTSRLLAEQPLRFPILQTLRESA